MSSDKLQIKINSILGGHSPTTHFAMEDQFRASLGINPSLPINDSFTTGSYAISRLSSGLLRPQGISHATGTTIGNPMWIIETPKHVDNLYVYDNAGSVYTLPDAYTTLTGIGDLNDGGDARGNGAAYYDNYVYFARATTIARYGPLNGTPVFTDDYWVTTLGKTKFEEGSGSGLGGNYPDDYDFFIKYPNHVLHRHSDGRLYIADVVGNTGSISFIQTTKTTIEGDTDNGSTYDKLNVGYGLYPTAMESYGSDLVIAFIELKRTGGSTTVKGPRAKLAFWDTTSTDVNQITWVEYPDSMITGLKNVNGVLYVASGNQHTEGFRITRFIGGYTFEDVISLPTGQPPFSGAMDGVGNKLTIGSFTYIPETAGCVYEIDSLRKVFNIVSLYGLDSDGASTIPDVICTALKLADASSGQLTRLSPIIGLSQGVKNHSLVKVGTDYSNAPSTWWSQLYRIGQPFKITKIRIPLAQVLDANMTVTPKIYIDSGSGSETLTAITSVNYGTNRQTIVIRPENLTADNDFWLELRWTGSSLCTVALPITIEYELLDD